MEDHQVVRVFVFVQAVVGLAVVAGIALTAYLLKAPPGRRKGAQALLAAAFALSVAVVLWAAFVVGR